VVLLHLDDDRDVAISPENRGQGRHAHAGSAKGPGVVRPEVIPRIGTLQLSGGELERLARETRGTVERAVVVHDDLSAAGKTDVELETVRAQRQPVVECHKGVLGRERRSAPVGEHEGPCRRKQRVRPPRAAHHR
jgi:hypothetical protein